MIIAFVVAVLLAIGDQLIKLLVVNTLKTGDTVSILNGLVEFFYCENEGMAFGMLQNGRWLFVTFTLAIIIGLVVYTVKTKPQG